jgi:hypothetical protein
MIKPVLYLLDKTTSSNQIRTGDKLYQSASPLATAVHGKSNQTNYDMSVQKINGFFGQR